MSLIDSVMIKLRIKLKEVFMRVFVFLMVILIQLMGELPLPIYLVRVPVQLISLIEI